MKLQCANCGKEVKKSPAQVKRSKTGNMYCSRSCSASNNNKLFKKWEKHPSYRHGKGVRYRDIKLSSIDSPKCEKCGFENLIALDVHHVDGNRSNNKLENLQILCANCHRIEHSTIIG